MKTVNRLFLSRTVVGVIEAALAKKSWQMLIASVDLDKIPPFPFTHTERQKQIGPQKHRAAQSREFPPTARFTLTAQNLECTLAAGQSYVNHNLGDSQSVINEISGWFSEPGPITTYI